MEVADPEPVYQPTGNTELDELVLQGHEAIRQMRQLSSQVKDKKSAVKSTVWKA